MKTVFTKPVMCLIPMVEGIDMRTLADQPIGVLEKVLQQCIHAEEQIVYQRNPNVVEREIGDEWVLVPTGSFAQGFNGMISLNEYSYFIWEQFRNPTSLWQVLDAARGEFNDEWHMMDIEIRAQVGDYVSMGLLQKVSLKGK